MESHKNNRVNSKEEVDTIKKDLSNKVNNEAKQIVKNEININIAMDALNEHINNGGKEFEQKIGRPMTYSEMREMWG